MISLLAMKERQNFAIAVGTIFIFIAFVAVSSWVFYKNIFRLSPDQIFELLPDAVSPCKEMSRCKLQAGDILIRRHITERTWIFDKLANPYFTHVAFYLGDDQFIEAGGKEENRKDDISVKTFSDSDWANSPPEKFVIIRPKNYLSKLDIIKKNLESIADDPNYVFGLPTKKNKKTTCADLIFKTLLAEEIILVSKTPKLITPDYLFWITKTDPENFDVVGYN